MRQQIGSQWPASIRTSLAHTKNIRIPPWMRLPNSGMNDGDVFVRIQRNNTSLLWSCSCLTSWYWLWSPTQSIRCETGTHIALLALLLNTKAHTLQCHQHRHHCERLWHSAMLSPHPIHATGQFIKRTQYNTEYTTAFMLLCVPTSYFAIVAYYMLSQWPSSMVNSMLMVFIKFCLHVRHLSLLFVVWCGALWVLRSHFGRFKINFVYVIKQKEFQMWPDRQDWTHSPAVANLMRLCRLILAFQLLPRWNNEIVLFVNNFVKVCFSYSMLTQVLNFTSLHFLHAHQFMVELTERWPLLGAGWMMDTR